MIDAMLANDPMLSTEAAEPMLPMLSTDPTDPIDRNELVDPMLRARVARAVAEPRVPGHGTRVPPLSREVTCPRLRSPSEHPAVRRPPGRSDRRALDRFADRSGPSCSMGLDDSAQWAVLVPGFTGSKEDFIALLPLLADAGRRSTGVRPARPVPVGRLRRAGRLRRRPARRRCPSRSWSRRRRRRGRTGGPHLVGHSFGGPRGPGGRRDRRTAPCLADPAVHRTRCAARGAVGGPARPRRRPRRARPRHDLADHAGDGGGGGPRSAATDRSRRSSRTVGMPTIRCSCGRWRSTSCASRTGRRSWRRSWLPGLPTTVMWGEHDDAWPVADAAGDGEAAGGRRRRAPRTRALAQRPGPAGDGAGAAGLLGRARTVGAAARRRGRCSASAARWGPAWAR